MATVLWIVAVILVIAGIFDAGSDQESPWATQRQHR